MAGQDVSELFVAGISGGRVRVAPVGTTAPVGLEDPTVDWVDMGYLSEDGFGLTPGIETEDIRVWPLQTVARTIVTEQSMELKLSFAQWNADTIAMYFGGSWTSDAVSGVKTLAVPTSRVSEYAVVIDAQDGRTYRYVLPRAALSDFEESKHTAGDIALLGFTMKVLPAAPDQWFTIATDDDAVVVPAAPLGTGGPA